MIKNIIFCLLFFALSFYSHAQSTDVSILKKINQPNYPNWDKAMKLTSFSVYPAMVVTPGSLFLSGYITHNKPMMRNGLKTAISIGLTIALTTGLKYAINRPRPFVQYPNDIIKRDDAEPYSFPSAHTSSAFATATALSLSTKKWYVAVPAYVYACGIGYSRMRLGMHYPSDVIGGMLLGIGSSLLVFKLDKLVQKK